jgi:PAS domain S-box-containing protein
MIAPDDAGASLNQPQTEHTEHTLDAALVELRTRLTMILGRTQLLRQKLDAGETIDRELGNMALGDIEIQVWAMDAALRASEERFRAIVEEATDYAIFTVDAQGRIDSWHAGADSIFGWTEAEAIGQPLHITYTPEDREAGVPEMEMATAREEGSAPDVRWHLRRDGYRVFIDGVVRARYAADGEFLGVLKIGQDVTERRLARQRQREEEERVRQELSRRVAAATAELRQLSRRLLLVQEEERRYLATELHDEIGQVLTGLALQLGTDPTIDAERLAEARLTVATLTEQVRNLSMDLRPAALDAYGLLPTLRWHLERYQHQTGIAVELLQEGLERRFNAPVEIAAYRIVQEALTNVARHAKTSRVVVQLFADDVALTVSIRDHGRGFDVSSTIPGSGLGGMRERAELLGGTLEIDATTGDGVTVTAELPLEILAMDTGIAEENTA